VLIHGGGDVGWYWHLVAAELRGRDHDVVAPDLPADDESATLTDYADAVVEAVDRRTDLVVVGHSFGAFTAPLVADRLAAELLVLVAGMMPAPASRRTTGGTTPDTTRRCGRRRRATAASRVALTRT
jgi:pimeloyl-ACP methyl ester carboxylesterase